MRSWAAGLTGNLGMADKLWVSADAWLKETVVPTALPIVFSDGLLALRPSEKIDLLPSQCQVI